MPARPYVVSLVLIMALASRAPLAGAQSLGAPPAERAAAAPPGAATLRAGDQLRLMVWDNPSLSGEFEIGRDGTIQHPLLADIIAVGVPLSELRARIATRLTEVDVKAPRFVMQPLLRVAVGGQVRTPGLYSMPADVTVMDAVLRGGGITERGQLGRVLLVRAGREESLDLTRTDQRDAQRPIQSGDQIIIPERRSVMRDYVVPISSVVGALGWIVTLFIDRNE